MRWGTYKCWKIRGNSTWFRVQRTFMRLISFWIVLIAYWLFNCLRNCLLQAACLDRDNCSHWSVFRVLSFLFSFHLSNLRLSLFPVAGDFRFFFRSFPVSNLPTAVGPGLVGLKSFLHCNAQIHCLRDCLVVWHWSLCLPHFLWEIWPLV